MNEEPVIPRELTPDSTIALVLERVSRGDGLLAACKSAGVPRSSFYNWLGSDKELAERYADAVRQQVHSRFMRG